MKIEFEKIEIQNFKSVGKVVSFDYRDMRGLNFVYGQNDDIPNAKNGSGKTTLLVEALSFALFGKTLKNTSNKYIPNRKIMGEYDSYVKLFLTSNGERYMIHTYFKTITKKTASLATELWKVDEDDSPLEDLTQFSIQQTRKYIEENILGFNFDLFKSSIVVSSADFMNFYEGMTKDQKRKYIENIFNLNCFGQMYMKIKSDLNDVRKEISHVSDYIIRLGEKRDEFTNKSREQETILENKRQDFKRRILEKRESYQSAKDQLEKFNGENETVTSEELENKQQQIKDRLDSIRTEQHRLEIENTRAESQISSTEREMNQIRKLSEGLCEKCTEFMQNKYSYGEKQDSIDSLKRKIQENSGKMTDKSGMVEKLKEADRQLSVKIQGIRTVENTRKSLERNVELLKRDLVNIKEEYQNFLNDKTSENPYVEIIEQTVKEIQDEREKLSDYKKKELHLDILKESCSEEGIKTIMIKDIVQLLNSLITKYLNEIGCSFMVYFDEKMEFRFITPNGDCEFSNFSAGEKQRIQIATLLSFRDLILSRNIISNVFIIDEMLDANVDSVCIENVMSILKRKSEEKEQSIFIISHRSELADNEGYWNNIIKVTKSNGESTYEVR